ncbi:MAG: hypothetical protein H6744_01170 [Deltaproteobacteria bacterium]|nr:hypothetical protein [Deltaproteobacteria bacterium]MCB9785278.1 hypothetical protein [Deltaproteobacteria bacterium]
MAAVLAAVGIAACSEDTTRPGGVITLPDGRIGDGAAQPDVAVPDAADTSADADASADTGGDADAAAEVDAAPDADADAAAEVSADADTEVDTSPPPPPPPTSGPTLLQWLQAGSYLTWSHETTPHVSSGAHSGNVRVYLNPQLVKSLNSGAKIHPEDAAAVMERYESTPDLVQGWDVWVKTAPTSDDGKNIYWYENFKGSVFANSKGASSCTSCHSAGLDFLQTSYPLQ